MGYNGRSFFFVVGYNGRDFFPLWDTTEEVFFLCGIQRRKIIKRRMIFLNIKCLSLPSIKKFGKISYLNSQTNPWKELKMENYMVNHEKKISIVGYNAAEIFLFLNFTNFTKINVSVK